MKRIAVVIGVVIGIAATPTMVAASGSSQSANADRYKLARTWNSQFGQLYGPVKVTPSSYGFLTK